MHSRYDSTGFGPSRFDTEARIAVAQATDIARELGHREVGPDHLLLGLLANARGSAYATLTDHGLRLDAAREIVVARHVDAVDPADSSGPDPAAKTGPTSYDADREALRAIGIDLDLVRQAVRDNLGEDLSEGWASRPDRGRRRGRGEGRGRGRGRSRGEERGESRGRHHHGHHRPDLDEPEGRGRRGPRSRRGEGPRFSSELRSLLRGVRRTARDEDLDAGRSREDRTREDRNREDRNREDRNREDRTREDRPRDGRRSGGGTLTGARLLVALTQSEDAVVRAILAGADVPEDLQQQAEVAAGATA